MRVARRSEQQASRAAERALAGFAATIFRRSGLCLKHPRNAPVFRQALDAKRAMTTSYSYVHLNGRLVPAARAHVSVFDRGLQFGDGLFETMRAYCGRPFALDRHLERLQRSAAALRMEIPRRPWGRQIEALLRKNRLLAVDARVRLTVTRGVGVPALVPPRDLKRTVIMTASPVEPEIAKVQKRGARVVLLPYVRSEALAGHKALNYLPAVLGKMTAHRRRAFEALFVAAGQRLTEGTTSNLFVWRRQRLVTPPTNGILPGVTRQLVMQLASEHGIRVLERRLTVTDLVTAEEAFLTGSVAEVVPVIAVDGEAIAEGRPGPLTRRLQQLYRQLTPAPPFSV
jgi:D-amino acid aminotransferase